MAFTEAQRADIRKYLGWPGRWFQTDSRLEQAMNGVTAEHQTQIVGELARLATIDTKLDSASTFFPASRDGNIGIEGAQNLNLLRSQGKQAAGRIAAILGVEVRHDVFSGSGPLGQPSNFLTGI